MPSENVVPLPPLVEPAAALTVDEVRRYSRHLIIPDVAMAGQRRLRNAKVLVVGAGGLGSPALMYLAAAGVGTLGIVDFDVVDESNLQRQVIHGQRDVGRPKAVSAAESVREINPYVEVVLHEERLESTNAMEIFAPYDLVVDGTDNFATRYLVNDACVLLGKPYVWGSIYRFDGQASVFWAAAPGDTAPCYRCLYPEPPPPGMVPSCAEGGVLGVLCASIGSVQVNEAIKLITGIGEPLVGRLLIYDALESSYREVKVRKDPECPVCGKNPTVTELIDYEEFCGTVSVEASDAVRDSTISATQLKAMMDRSEDFLLVDVREPAEWDIVRIPGSVLIPKDEILSGEALGRLPQDRPVVVHCKSGGRSAEVLAALKAAGFADARHVGGGVLAWANQIDPSLPTY
jgi:adenylyltransferase/sulfurtransferase